MYQRWPLLTRASCRDDYAAAYSLEDWHGMDRYHFDAIVTPQDFNDTCVRQARGRGACRALTDGGDATMMRWAVCRYLPAWEACVRDGNASAIMCSYNAVRMSRPVPLCCRVCTHLTPIAQPPSWIHRRVANRRMACRRVRTSG